MNHIRPDQKEWHTSSYEGPKIYDVVIVGAGLSGLIAARQLSQSGWNVLVLDKGRGVGGRLSRRRTQKGDFDHGAQYFTVSRPTFRSWVDAWVAKDIVKAWSDGFLTQDGVLKVDGKTRFCGKEGMNQIAKDLARGLDICLQQRVTRLDRHKTFWEISTDSNAVFRGNILLLTPPVPQSLDLLRSCDIPLDQDTWTALRAIQYEPCLALMVALTQPSRVPMPGGVWMSGEPVAWIADNARKSGHAHANGRLTIHAGPEFSRKHWDTPEETVAKCLLEEVSAWIQGEPELIQLHRWRYGKAVHFFPESFLFVPGPPHLAFAGDAFGGAKMEGAACSGLEVATSIQNHL